MSKERFVIFHHNDFDGVASAAILKDALEKSGAKVPILKHVSYDILSQWKKESFFKPYTNKGFKIAVLDFSYHPAADIWMDHHNGPFKKEKWQHEFKPDGLRRWEPGYHSCAHQVLDACRKQFVYKPSQHIREVVKWADIIDFAAYKSAKQALDLGVPAIGLTRAIGAMESAGKSLQLVVKAIQHGGISLAVRLPVVARAIRYLQKTQKDVAAYYREHSQTTDDGKIVYVDESGIYGRQQRYFIYFFHPQSNYGVRYFLQTDTNTWHISVGWNPWNHPKKGINIGQLLKHISPNGGGHEAVGGMEFKREREARAAIRRVLAALSGK